MPDTPRTRPRACPTSTPAGDPDAIALLCHKRVARRAHKLLDGRLGSENAESIATDVFVWLTERRVEDPGFLNSPAALRRGIDRRLFDELRKAVKGLSRLDEEADVDEIIGAGKAGARQRRSSPDEIFAEKETAWHVHRAIAQLPPQMQRVTRLCDLEEWSTNEAAMELGITPGTVRQIRHQAKAKLRTLLELFGGLHAA
jgi:RNA polymerase sigma factor (sigma-70 family)